MIQRILIFIVSISILAGCSSKTKEDNRIVVKIDNITVTKSDFEKEFANSVYSRVDTPKTRAEFLNYLISKKLILREAERNKIGP